MQQNEFDSGASSSKAGDICLYDISAGKLIIVDGETFDASAYPSSNFSPVGVVVVPGTHNIYGDGSCGVMSLRDMDCNSPSTGGTSDINMYWGEYGIDISTLRNLDVVPVVGSGSNVGNASSTVTGAAFNAFLPSDRFNAVQCPHDTDTYYWRSSSSYDQAPSPYLTDGSRNPAYYQTTSPSSSRNSLADFDGIGNTEKMIAERGTKDYNSWKPDSSSGADYPAASCCDMFHTEGTQQGDWYLPACGELGYILPSFNKISAAINKICAAYGSSVGVELAADYEYWSSTETDFSFARIVATSNGYVGDHTKNLYRFARAFLRVNP